MTERGERRAWIFAARFWVIIFLAFLYLPIVMLILFSVQKNQFASFPLLGFSTEWYEKLFNDGTLITALGNSLIVSPAAATLATIISFLAAYALNRFDFRGRNLLSGGFIVPVLIPGLILGVACLGLLSRLHLSGELYSVFLMHVLLTTAPALAIIQLRLSQLPRSHEEAAWDLGATEWQALRRVVIPWALPGIVGGWLLAFTFSFDEFMIAWFVAGFDQTLPVAIFSVLKAVVDPSLNAIGTIVFLISGIVLIGVEMFVLPLVFGRDQATESS